MTIPRTTYSCERCGHIFPVDVPDNFRSYCDPCWSAEKHDERWAVGRHDGRSRKFRDVALLVGGTVHHAGGNILNVRVVHPNDHAIDICFGMEPGDVVGWDRTVSGEYVDSGELGVLADEPAETIAAAINAFMKGRRP